MPHVIKKVEIIIIDDGSVDTSIFKSELLVKKYDNVRIVIHGKNSGKGACIKTGIAHAKGDILIVQDADDELNPDNIPLMIETLVSQNIDMVNGSRFLKIKNQNKNNAYRTFGNIVLSMLTSLLTGAKITDVTCGYKLFRKSLWQKLDIKENGFAFEVEIILKTLKTGKNNVLEVPVDYNPRKKKDGKKIKTKDTFVILWAIFKYGLLRK